jgi:phenylpyruvate tautomerase PptA (4-oxalocrotonate tautomerase family)
MPLIEIEVIGPSRLATAKLTRQLAGALGETLGSPPASTWVRLRTLPASHYAESSTARPVGAKAIFVTITHRKLSARARLRREASEISRIVGKICHRSPEQVHVIYEPPGAGRIAFGGQLIE